jgi:Kef-type K+ transport system membrane component KefB
MNLPFVSPFALLLADESTLNVPLVMLIVFFSAKLLAEAFEWIGQPGIVGEILAGVIIGPSVLNWVAPGTFLSHLSEIGVMFLLFRVGLEVKSSEMLRAGGTGFIVAACGVIVPFFMGWGILSLWGYSRIESIFVGASMVATSVGITAQVLSARGLLSHRASQVILAAAVIDDVLGLLVLALVSSMARGHVNVLEIGLTITLASGFVVLVALWGGKAMRAVAPHVEEKLRVAEAEFALAILFMLGCSVLAVYAGVAAIVGAFLAGMAMGESAGERVRTLVHGGSELLVPFFLAGIGLRIDLNLLRNPPTVVLALVILAAACVSKFIGCGIGALGMGYSNALRVGVGMVPRGEVGMIVAQIGLAVGAMSTRIYDVVVFMAVATTLLAPPLIKIFFEPGALKSLEEADSRTF